MSQLAIPAGLLTASIISICDQLFLIEVIDEFTVNAIMIPTALLLTLFTHQGTFVRFIKMIPIKLKLQLARQLTGLLSRYPNIRLAILFGSQANPERQKHFGSDIDLAIMTDAPVSDRFKMQLMEAISTKFGYPVDIVDVSEAPEPILGKVFKGQRLLGDDTAYAQLLTRHLLNTADFVPLRERILKERRDRWIR